MKLFKNLQCCCSVSLGHYHFTIHENRRICAPRSHFCSAASWLHMKPRNRSNASKTLQHRRTTNLLTNKAYEPMWMNPCFEDLNNVNEASQLGWIKSMSIKLWNFKKWEKRENEKQVFGCKVLTFIALTYQWNVKSVFHKLQCPDTWIVSDKIYIKPRISEEWRLNSHTACKNRWDF